MATTTRRFSYCTRRGSSPSRIYCASSSSSSGSSGRSTRKTSHDSSLANLRVLVDGYNLAGKFDADPAKKARKGRKTKSPQAYFQSGRLEDARDMLDDELRHFATARGAAVAVAYDAMNSTHTDNNDSGDGDAAVWMTGSKRGSFARFFVTDNSADGFIERTCAEMLGDNDARLVVVTDDSAEATVARGYGAEVQSCTSFVAECRSLRASSKTLVADADKAARRAEGRRAGRLAGQLDPTTLAQLEQLRRGL